MVPEAPLEETEHGLVPKGDGWFVLNAREARWYHADGRGSFCHLEGDQENWQLGINVQVLQPGDPMAMYHWEADQEDFLVVAGEALLIVEGGERPLREWDFAHCPPETKHTIIGAGEGPASSSRSAPASIRTLRAGAATARTRSHSDTRRASSRRRPTRTRPMPRSARAAAHASTRATAKAGCPARRRRCACSEAARRRSRTTEFRRARGEAARRPPAGGHPCPTRPDAART